jgi:hypothetical protein
LDLHKGGNFAFVLAPSLYNSAAFSLNAHARKSISSTLHKQTFILNSLFILSPPQKTTLALYYTETKNNACDDEVEAAVVPWYWVGRLEMQYVVVVMRRNQLIAGQHNDLAARPGPAAGLIDVFWSA